MPLKWPRSAAHSQEEEQGAQDLCFLIQRAARVVARRFDNRLRPFGLTHGKFILLEYLISIEPSSMTSLASLLAMDRTTLAAALKTLEANGLVKTVILPTDRRFKQIELTHRGLDLLK